LTWSFLYSVSVGGRQRMLELLNFNLSIVINVEELEHILQVLLCEQLLMIDGSRNKFIEVQLAITIKVNIIEDVSPSPINTTCLLEFKAVYTISVTGEFFFR